jgi:hypothetical protein
MQLGLEAEYWVVDGEGRLTDGRPLLGAHERAEGEFVAPMIEIATPPAPDVETLEREFLEALRAVLDGAEREGTHVVPLGTPITADALPAVTERGRFLERLYGPGLDAAKRCAGTHVHFEKRNVVEQVNLLTALDPALALVSSSPYYEGERLAYCSRAYAYRRRTGEAFSRYRDVWEYMESLGEWNARLGDAYDELRTLASERGIDDTTFERHVKPENAVLTPVRLRYGSPTVEWRTPDTALPSQILRLVGDVERLVRRTEELPLDVGDEPGANDEGITIPAFRGLETITRQAIFDGITDDVAAYLRSMGIEPDPYEPIAAELAGPDRVDVDEARELRLRYADRLREDVAGLAGP